MINGELIVDNFAGGGGASTGIELATGLSVDIAINHDPQAILMHKTNHPGTKHYCESVWDVDPVKVCCGHPVALAWFSPDCKHFSKAKGGKPKDKNIRGLAWVACRWAGLVRPRVIMLENVEEFKTWGPLNRGHRPVKAKQGTTFHKFIQQLTELGYEVQFKELVAADYGAPTTRKRFFLIARCDGNPIVWPEPTHAPADSKEVKAGLMKPYVGAYTQIDFSRPCPSIFDTSEEIMQKYGIRAVRPLAENTMKRIAQGMKKYVLNNKEPFIVQVNHSGAKSDYCRSMNEPLSTITQKHGFGIVELEVAPFIDKAYGGNYQGSGSALTNPLDTITTVDHNRLVEATLVPYMGVNTSNHPGGSCAEPLHTITTGNQHCVISPILIQYHSETSQDTARGQSVREPLFTVDSSNRYGLVQSFLRRYYDPQTYDEPCLHLPPTDPQVVRNQLQVSFMVQMNNHCDGRDLKAPLPTITAGDGHFGEVRAFLSKYYGSGTEQNVKEPLNTITARDRLGLVTIEGITYQIVDIGLRMLEPKELYGCQGFPEDYIIDRDYNGRAYPRSEQVRRCGNAVCPPIPAVLVKSNLPELCKCERTPNMKIGEEKDGQLKFA